MGNRWGGAASYAVAANEPFPGPLEVADPNFEVGVIDSGIVVKDGHPHPPLAGHLTPCWTQNVDPLPHDGRILDDVAGHGTFTAGLILAEAPKATIRMRRVLGLPSFSTDEATASAIHEFAELPNIKVVNMSFFGPRDRTSDPDSIKAAIEYLIQKHTDVVIVAAAGNYWTDRKSFPAAFAKDFCHQMISVGAIDNTVLPDDEGRRPKASFSNYGDWVTCYADGVQRLGPRCTYRELVADSRRPPPQNYTGMCRWSGTSFAAATVAGRIAGRMLDGHTSADAMRDVLAGLPSPELSTSET